MVIFNPLALTVAGLGETPEGQRPDAAVAPYPGL